MPFPAKELLQPLSQLLETALGDRTQEQFSYLEVGWGIFAFVDPSKVKLGVVLPVKQMGMCGAMHSLSQKPQEIDEVQNIVLFP